jgi:hypothetical protein
MVRDFEYVSEARPTVDGDGRLVSTSEARELGVGNAIGQGRPQGALAEFDS